MAMLLTCMDLVLIIYSQDNNVKQIVHHLAVCCSAFGVFAALWRRGE